MGKEQERHKPYQSLHSLLKMSIDLLALHFVEFFNAHIVKEALEPLDRTSRM